MLLKTRRLIEQNMNATDTVIPLPDLFTPNPYLSDEFNRNIIQSEIEGGVYLRDLPCGAVLRIETHDWICTMIYCVDGAALLVVIPCSVPLS